MECEIIPTDTSLCTNKSNFLARFRWVFCQLDALKKCKKRTSLLKALKSLPKTLDETYERILMNVDEECQEEARRIDQTRSHSGGDGGAVRQERLSSLSRSRHAQQWI